MNDINGNLNLVVIWRNECIMRFLENIIIEYSWLNYYFY